GNTPEINVHHPFEVVVGHFPHSGREGHTGVVDNQVNLAKILADLRGVGVDGVPVGDIQAVGFHLGTVQAGSGFRQPRLVDIGESQPTAPGREGFGQGSADTGASTGDDSHLVVQIFHGGNLL